ncbi:hypothetical protein [uncultured Sphingomonas sp.]|uniref:hypothetical protein n=1 Tax=uncultured Sphingomonas sp. TaxID=158754 RepID=UPI00261E1BBE|nr:hypothetical protein [uncultured Sphingomonas sp.]
MTEDDFDKLVDDATHAVNNLIPAHLLDGMTAGQRSDLLVQVNDALTPTLRDLMEPTDEPGEERPQTRPRTMSAFVTELIETHMAKCECAGEHPDDRPPHIISEAFGTHANVESISTAGNEIAAAILLVLDDGTAFRFTIECVERV